MTHTEKAARYDEIVKAAQYYFEAFGNEWRLALNLANAPNCDPDLRMNLWRRVEKMGGLMHEYWNVLKIADVEGYVCGCAFCDFSAELINEAPESFKETCARTQK